MKNNSVASDPKMSPMRLLFEKIGLAIEWIEVTLLCTGVTMMAAFLIVNVFARNFYRSIFFTEEAVRFLIIFVTFVGMSYGVRKARHIRMGAIFDAMNLKIKKILIILISSVGAVVMFLLTYHSYLYVQWGIERGIVTPSLLLPIWTFYVIMPIMFFSSGIHYIRTIFKNLHEEEVWLSPEQQSEYDAVDEFESQ